MKKAFCDCCKKEINGRIFPFELLKHIEGKESWGGHVVVVDGKSVPISGVTEMRDLCLLCYNEVMSAAYKKFCEMLPE